MHIMHNNDEKKGLEPDTETLLRAEKVKKGKTIIIQALIGLLVIFLASSIVTFVMTSLFSNAV